MPKAIKRGAGARFGGVEAFLNLKKVFDDAVRQKQWEKEKLYFGEESAMRRTALKYGLETGQVGVSLATGQGLEGRDLEGRDLGRGVRLTPGDPSRRGEYEYQEISPGVYRYREPLTGKTQIITSSRERVGEELPMGVQGDVQAVLSFLRKRKTPQGRLLRSREEAEDFVREMGVDPNWDRRVKLMLRRYKKISPFGKRAVVPRFSPLRALPWVGTPGPVEIPDIEDLIRKFEAGDVSAQEELNYLIEQGLIEYDPTTNEINF